MTTGTSVTCAREGCDKVFSKKTHNQKYCSDFCCRKATNAKIMKEYYRKKEQKNRVRSCAECGSKLRKNSQQDYCSLCIARAETEEKTMVLNQIAGIVWD